MSRLRPCLSTTTKPRTADGATAYYIVYGAVLDHSEGLCHGKLHDREKGLNCAIGSYFVDHPLSVLNETFIDEVAAVNDAVPTATPKQRRDYVLRWLKWKLTQYGFEGFRTKQPPAPDAGN